MTSSDREHLDAAQALCRRQMDDEISASGWTTPVLATLGAWARHVPGLDPLCAYDIAIRDDLAETPFVEALFRWRVRHNESPVDPLACLGRGGNQYRCLFRSRDMSETFVAAGALLTAQVPPSTSETSSGGLRWFGGLPFSREPSSSSTTGDSFVEGLFFLPEMEWHCTRDEWHLRLRSFVAPGLATLLTGILDRHLNHNIQIDRPRVTLAKSEDCPTFDLFEAMVKRALSRIDSHNKNQDTPPAQPSLSKVVLARQKTLVLTPPDVDHRFILRELAAIKEESYLFAFEMPSGEVFLGRPPERILRWREGHVEVDALAGTRQRDKSKESDDERARTLSSSSKDLNEHRWVANFVEKRLGEVCDEVRREENESILKLKNVQHILTRFCAKLKPTAQARDLLYRLHPTPAVGGVPTDEALKFLAVTETFDRRWFAGAVGYSDGPSGDFAIGIRTAFLRGDQLTLIAGAGIVEGSEPAEEWREIELKFKNFLDLFAPPAAP